MANASSIGLSFCILWLIYRAQWWFLDPAVCQSECPRLPPWCTRGQLHAQQSATLPWRCGSWTCTATARMQSLTARHGYHAVHHLVMALCTARN